MHPPGTTTVSADPPPTIPAEPPPAAATRALARRAISWAWLSSQALVIVASILLAFSIDTWAAGRGERVQEQRYLALLAAEFGAARDAAVVNGTVRARARHASAALIGQAQGAAPRR